MINKTHAYSGREFSLVGIVLGAISWVVLTLMAGTILWSAILNSYVIDDRLAIIGGCFFWGNPVVAFIGLVMGIAGMVKRNSNRLGAIAGVAVPGSALLAEMMFFLVAVYATLTVLSNQP